MWNHYDNLYDRKQNRVEGDNNKMKLFCGAANPNIDKAHSKTSLYEAEHHKRNSNLKQLKDLLNDGSITLKVYLDRIIDIHKFEPKKKYVTELADTDESDDEEGEDGDESDEEYGDTPQPSQPICELRVQINEDDVTTTKNKKEKCEISNKEFFKLKTHMTRIHRQ
ncbi:unnamed protein product [Brachionus calyciflorus]|uniref:Uncharacterized protein n=1 Tax=Brachionus calyciflorus TaxID=104777 RepID=A0A814T0A4_9BILA|nr:unnamed protein product [Brachionus calyciflorus]